MVDSNGPSVNAAFSSDGIRFQTSRLNPLAVPGPDSFDQKNISPEAIFKEDGTYYLFYQAVESVDHIQGRVMIFDDPEGAVTKTPLMPPRLNATQPILERDGTNMTVADSGVFELGEPVMISGPPDRWEINRIVGIQNKQTILLQSPLRQLYENPNLDSLFRRKVYPTYVWKDRGVWQLIITAFQPNGDDGVREFVARASGLTLADITFDYWKSPLAGPSSSLDRNYYAESFENLTAISLDD